MLNELKSHKNLDIYVSGSNSKTLSKDVLTEFRGRASEIHIYPLSFKEIYDAFGGDKKAMLDQYMLYGGMPHIFNINNDNDKKSYLINLNKELYLKDIIERNKLEREDLLGEILSFIASQIGSLTNTYNIANALTILKKEKINSQLVSKYLSYLEDSFLIETAKRYDIKGKSYFNYPNK